MTDVKQSLASGQIDDTALNTIFEVNSTVYLGAVVYKLALTNQTSNIITVAVYVNNNTDDLHLKTIKIPASNSVIVRELIGTTLTQGNAIKLQSNSADAFNYRLDGEQTV